jgi:hypothetical protein
MTVEDIYVNYNNVLLTFASTIDKDSPEDLVGDWLLDMLIRGQKHIDTMIKEDGVRVKLGILKMSLYQSWYNRRQTKQKRDAVFVSYVDVKRSNNVVAPYFDDPRLTKTENNAVRYIITSGNYGRLPVYKKDKVYKSIGRKIFHKTPTLRDKPVTGFKVCAKCGEKKQVTEFHVNRGSIDGRSSYCKACVSKYYKRKH